MEVQVVVNGERPFSSEWSHYRAVESFFVFVSLGSDGKVKAVPPLLVSCYMLSVDVASINIESNKVHKYCMLPVNVQNE